ncbi:MAG TPA: organomercurial lyase [Thermomicrobiales bacterium]|nr:organomercurial lyase [Thermomicrobiales bacterium]
MSRAVEDAEVDWRLRAEVYRQFADRGRAPTADELAVALGADSDAIQDGLARLHDRHALLLDPADRSIRMANPFSAVPTSFRVQVGTSRYWANCAWDALGIPAALHADADIDATYGDDGAPVAIAIDGGALRGGGGVVHFPLPVARWYDDLIET